MGGAQGLTFRVACCWTQTVVRQLRCHSNMDLNIHKEAVQTHRTHAQNRDDISRVTVPWRVAQKDNGCFAALLSVRIKLAHEPESPALPSPAHGPGPQLFGRAPRSGYEGGQAGQLMLAGGWFTGPAPGLNLHGRSPPRVRIKAAA